MKIPHIYFVLFKTKHKRKIYYTYFGLHRSWDSTWDRIYKLKIDKDKEYIYGTFLPWKALFYILMPFDIFYEDDTTKKK